MTEDRIPPFRQPFTVRYYFSETDFIDRDIIGNTWEEALKDKDSQDKSFFSGEPLPQLFYRGAVPVELTVNFKMVRYSELLDNRFYVSPEDLQKQKEAERQAVLDTPVLKRY